MGNDLDIGRGLAIAAQFGSGKALMDLAGAFPEDHLHVGLLGNVLAQVVVGQEYHPIDAQRLDDPHSVGGCAADIGFRLDVRAGIHIGHHRHPGITLLEQADVLTGDGSRQRATGAKVRDQDLLLGIDDLRRLGHEVHAAQHDDVGIRFAGLLRQAQGIPRIVGHAVINLGRLVIVGQDYRVALNLQFIDERDVGGVYRPLDLGNDIPHQFVRGMCRRGHLGGIGESLHHDPAPCAHYEHNGPQSISQACH